MRGTKSLIHKISHQQLPETEYPGEKAGIEGIWSSVSPHLGFFLMYLEHLSQLHNKKVKN